MKKPMNQGKLVCIILLVVLVVTLAVVAIVFLPKDKTEKDPDEIVIGDAGENQTIEVEITDEDPQEIIVQTKPETGAQVEVEEVVVKNENETQEITIGIDVSKYQGTIDWKKVSEAGIDFAMIRVGYRTMLSGEIVADTNAKYNMQEAQKNGIKVGAYFFSTAVNEAEAKEEANWVSSYISKYKITYPVAYDCEGFESADSRHHDMTNAERTDVALTFLDQIKANGYEGMFYASKGAMENDAQWETGRIASKYKVWVAQYPSVPYPETKESSYSGEHAMWQYTSQGSIAGINKKVDINIAYFGYEKEEEAKDEKDPDKVEADEGALMNFTDVNEKVTAKDKVNLRDKPSQGNDAKVIYALENGDVALRTGTSDSGWSRIEYKGKTLYAVSSFLTTDLDYRKPVEEPDDGINTEFTKVNDKVTAKEVVNLRSKPSVDDSVAPVVTQLTNGDVAIRTGVNTELGWARVEFNGQILYCINSYLLIIEE